MKELTDINWMLNNGFTPEKFMYCSPVNDRRLYMNHFPQGFMNLPYADLIIDRMMFYAKLRLILEKKIRELFE